MLQPYFDNGRLMKVLGAGCAAGYKDALTGEPHQKRFMFITDMLAVVDAVEKLRCSHGGNHSIIRGTTPLGTRSALTARWPEVLSSLFMNRSLAHLHLRDYESALADTQATLSFIPDYPKAHVRAAICFCALAKPVVSSVSLGSLARPSA